METPSNDPDHHHSVNWTVYSTTGQNELDHFKTDYSQLDLDVALSYIQCDYNINIKSNGIDLDKRHQVEQVRTILFLDIDNKLSGNEHL